CVCLETHSYVWLIGSLMGVCVCVCVAGVCVCVCVCGWCVQDPPVGAHLQAGQSAGERAHVQRRGRSPEQASLAGQRPGRTLHQAHGHTGEGEKHSRGNTLYTHTHTHTHTVHMHPQ